ncbi:MAG: YraN family protein [candidate division WOR-3 bacterium]
MMINKIQLGKKGEELARKFLNKKGFNIIDHNFRCRYGEIDLVLRKGKSFHFVEVKYRRTLEYGLPQESVNKRKQKKIQYVALLWLKKRHLPIDTEVHFDVLAINQSGDGVEYEYIEDAF